MTKGLALLVVSFMVIGCASMTCVPKVKVKHEYRVGARCGF